LKVKFGSAWPGENKDNEIVSIPGLRERAKEISLKNLLKLSMQEWWKLLTKFYRSESMDMKIHAKNS
jgi:hypothetical protein